MDRDGFWGLGRGRGGQLWRGGGRFTLDLGEVAIHRQSDGVVVPSEEKAVGWDLLLKVHVYLALLVVLQAPHTLEGAGAALAQVIDEELDLKLAGVGGSEPHSTREVRLYARSKGDGTHLSHLYRPGELYQIQLHLLAHFMRKGVEKE